MHMLREEGVVKEMMATLEDPVEEMMFEDSLGEGLVNTWLQNMPRW